MVAASAVVVVSATVVVVGSTVVVVGSTVVVVVGAAVGRGRDGADGGRRGLGGARGGGVGVGRRRPAGVVVGGVAARVPGCLGAGRPPGSARPQEAASPARWSAATRCWRWTGPPRAPGRSQRRAGGGRDGLGRRGGQRLGGDQRGRGDHRGQDGEGEPEGDQHEAPGQSVLGQVAGGSCRHGRLRVRAGLLRSRILRIVRSNGKSASVIMGRRAGTEEARDGDGTAGAGRAAGGPAGGRRGR